METVAALIESSGLAHLVAGNSWGWPIAEMFHFLGMAVLFGTIGMIDLRILGIGKGVPVGELERLVPWGLAGFAVVLFTGLCFVAGEQPSPLYFMQSNLAFRLKMVFIFLAGLNALAFYVFGIAKQVDALPPDASAGIAAKTVAVLSLVLWTLVITMGRYIMYDATLLDFLGM